jgi:flagellin
MAMGINTNVMSLNAQRQLSQSNNAVAQAMERLSSGLRINSAKDDAAGLGITNRMTTQIRGLNQAIRNANDGISLAQTAEGALQESTSILQRMRELAVQSANDSNSPLDRANLQKEVTQLQAELTRIAETTTFNGKKLFDGSFTAQKFHVGANANETIAVTIGAARATDMGNYAATSSGGDIATAVTAAAALPAANNVDLQTLTVSGALGSANTAAIGGGSTAKAVADAVNAITASTGVTASARTTATLSSVSLAGTVTFDLYGENSAAQAISVAVSNASDLTGLATEINKYAATTGITAEASGGSVTLTSNEGYDIGIANFTVDSAGNQTASFQGATGAAVTLTEGGNDSSRVGGTVSFASSSSYTVTSNANAAGLFAATTATVALASVGSVNVGTQGGANTALSILDGALAFVSDTRADLGAVQNRFQSTISNLSNVSENVSAARSRVQDADFAAETAALTRAQILQQAGVAMLAQANAQPQSVLSLLQ